MAGPRRKVTSDDSTAPHGKDRADHTERLKERLLREGARSLSENQVLALLLSFVMPGKDAKPLAKQLTARFGGLQGVLIASARDLISVAEVSEHAAALIRLAGELVARCAETTRTEAEILGRPHELERYLLARMRGLTEERILLILFDHQGTVLAEEFVGAGTIDEAVMFPRQIMELALRSKAGRIIVAHNHLHGPPLPTVQDREEAEHLREILRPFDITLEDSIVVGQTRCFSIFKNTPLGDTSGAKPCCS